MMKTLERLLDKLPTQNWHGSVATERTYTKRYDKETATMTIYHYATPIFSVDYNDMTYTTGESRSQSDSRARNDLIRYYSDMNYKEKK